MQDIDIRVTYSDILLPDSYYSLSVVIDQWYVIVGYPNSLYFDVKGDDPIEYTLESMTDGSSKAFCDGDCLRVSRALTLCVAPTVDSSKLLFPDARRVDITYNNLEPFLDYSDIWSELFKSDDVISCFTGKTITDRTILMHYLDNATHIKVKSIPDYLDDKEVVLKVLKIDPMMYISLGDEMKSDLEVSRCAINYGLPIKFMYHDCLELHELAIDALKINVENIHYFGESVRFDKEIVKMCITYDETGRFVLFSEFSHDYDMIKFAVTHHGMMSLYLSDFSLDYDLIRLALRCDNDRSLNNSHLIESDLLYSDDFLDEFIKEFPEIYQSIPECMKTYKRTKDVLTLNGSMYLQIPEELRSCSELKNLALNSPDCDVYIYGSYLTHKMKCRWHDVMYDYIF